MLKVWDCKIGFATAQELPNGADTPLRVAVEEAFKKVLGRECDFCFSNQGGKLNEEEANAVLEDKVRREREEMEDKKDDRTE